MFNQTGLRDLFRQPWRSHGNQMYPTAWNKQKHLENTWNNSFQTVGQLMSQDCGLWPEENRRSEHDLSSGKLPAPTKAVSKCRAWGQAEQGMGTSLRTQGSEFWEVRARWGAGEEGASHRERGTAERCPWEEAVHKECEKGETEKSSEPWWARRSSFPQKAQQPRLSPRGLESSLRTALLGEGHA